MANQIPEEPLAAIEDVVCRHPDGVAAPKILRALANPIPLRTLQYRLRHLVIRNRLIIDGEGRWAKYRMANTVVDRLAREAADELNIPVSEAGTSVRDYIAADDFACRFSMQTGGLMWFLGAGASAAAGIPTVWDMIWEFKQQLYVRQRRVSPKAVADLSNPTARRFPLSFIDGPGRYPSTGAPDEYAALFEAAIRANTISGPISVPSSPVPNRPLDTLRSRLL